MLMRKKTPRDGSWESCVPGKLSFEFSHCAIFGGGPCVEWNGKNSELRWRDAFGDSWHPLPTPTEIQWKAFWLLMEQSGVWKWNHDYNNPNILDGIGWDFKLTAPGLRIETSGSNAYPGSDSFELLPGSPFDVLSTAIGILVGCEVHDLKAPPHSQINPGFPPDVEVDLGDGEEGPLV
jgi:hypothetical protein